MKVNLVFSVLQFCLSKRVNNTGRTRHTNCSPAYFNIILTWPAIIRNSGITVKLWGPERRARWDVKRGRLLRQRGGGLRKLRSVLAVPLAQARAGGGEAAAGGPWEVPLMTSHPWRRRRDVRKCDIATSLGGGGLSNAPAVHQRGTSARPLAISLIS